MSGAFDWIGKLFDFIFSLFPRLVIITAVNRGIKWRFGKQVISLEPGLHIYLPLVTEILIIASARQTHEIPSQALMTKDLQEVVISSIVTYKIEDVKKAVGEENWDYSGNLTDLVQSIIVEIVLSYTLDELIEGLAEGEESELNQRLTNSVHEEMEEFGLIVERCKLTEISRPVVVKLIGDSKCYGEE